MRKNRLSSLFFCILCSFYVLFSYFCCLIMVFSVNVIVLRCFMFADTKMMVDVLSPDEGRLSCVLRTGKSKAAMVRRQIFQPLALLELTLERKSVGQLPTIKEAHIATPYSTIPFHPYKLTISMFLAEFLCSTTRSEQQTGALYHYISDSMQWLDTVGSNFSNFHLVFMMRLTQFVGFYPNLDSYAEGCSFDLQSGCFVPYTQHQHGFLDAEDSKKMYLLMRMNYQNMHLFKMSHTERNRCLDVILEFYSLHVPDFHELKSLGVLREIFE